MKRVFALMIVLLSVVVCFSACKNVDGYPAKDGDTVILTVTQEHDGVTFLIDYMEHVSGSDELSSYVINDGMVVVINDLRATGNVYWMLYTDDAEYSNEAWGTVEVDGVTYYSATLGAEELPVKVGCTYVWYAQAF